MNLSVTSPQGLLIVYCFFVAAASLAGGWALLVIHPSHRQLQAATSFVAGLMLGIALLHFLPDAAEHLSSIDKTTRWMLGGFLCTFFLQRLFHFHHHDGDESGQGCGCEVGHEAEEPQGSHGHEHHGHDHGHTHGRDATRHISWIGAALGLILHSLLDGLALGASVVSGTQSNAGLAGLGVALVIILHKPFDAMAISTLMTMSGCSKFARHVFNSFFALASPLGAVLFWFGLHQVAGANSLFLGCSLAFCAGTFLCIAGSDLLPELQFHSHDRVKLSIALMLGLGVAIFLKAMEG